MKKELKFNHIEAENIKRGVQTATLRIHDEKNISVNDEIEVIDKVKESEPDSWKKVGIAKVTKVVEQRISDLDINDKRFESFGSTAELYRQLALFYGDKIEEETIIKVIYFYFSSQKESKMTAKNDDFITTKVTEMKLYSDGGSRGNPGPSASGFVLMDMKNNIIDRNGEYLHITTNNQAEYHSLVIALERALQLGAKTVHVYMDSLLVIKQLKREYRVKNEDLRSAFNKANSLVAQFEVVYFNHVPRELNKLADAEVNRILDSRKNMV